MKSRMRSHSKSDWRLNSSIVRLVELTVGKQPHEPDRRGLDEVQAGRFQRLQESRGKTDRDAIAVPHLAALAGRETQPVRVRQLLTVEVGQAAASRLIRRRCSGSNKRGRCRSGAAADAPLPTRLASGRPRQGDERLDPRARHRHRAVARQPVRPVLVSGLQRLLDQQAAEAGAVDEEIRFDPAVAFERDRRDVAAVAHFDIDDLPLGALDAVLLGEGAQISRVERRIEVEGVGDVADRGIAHVGAGAA